MALRFKKSDWQQQEHNYIVVFRRAAPFLSERGREALGSLAWGRHGVEYGPDGGLQDVCRAAGWLDGYFSALCRTLDKADMDILLHWQAKMYQGRLYAHEEEE